ncbi:MAG TPA: hypothetical protein VMU19_00100 [Bryobacteraceae bacterium]|nr:hypothetical protein [Bryobacteraceae bacterium]
MQQKQAIRAGRKFVQHIVPAVVKPAHILWHEVIGFIFLCLGATFGFYTARYAWRGDGMRTTVAGIATAIMIWYGIDGFRKARKISRS